MSANETPPPSRSPWAWIPTLYFAEGLPYVVVMIVSVIMYKNLGVSNTEIALYTSWLYLPWVIKPFWSPLVDVLRSKRWWIVVMQLLIGAGLAGVALTIPTSNFLQYTLLFLWLLAFSSATHDIAADGFYMLAMSTHQQAWFVGIRSTFYRLAMIVGQGVLVMIAGLLQSYTGLEDVKLQVVAGPRFESSAEFSPTSASTFLADGPMRLSAKSETLEISTQPVEPAKVQRILEQVKAWNIEHDFYAEEDASITVEQNAKASWLAQIEEFIATRFGPDEPTRQTNDLAGNIGIFYLGISKQVPNDTEVVVNLQKTSGSNDIRILEGERFRLTDQNSEHPFAVLVQVDDKLTSETATVFTARSGNTRLAWILVSYLMAATFLAFSAYHAIVLPKPEKATLADNSSDDVAKILNDFVKTFVTFFQKPRILTVLAFLLIYRFSEAQLAKMAAPFLLDGRGVGGLGLTTTEVGFVYGTVGVVMLTLGGILGGLVAAKQGLKFWLGWMVLAINLPNAVYLFLSQVQPESYLAVNLAVAVEQFGYGFGFTAYMLYMLYIAQGEHQTAHYAICTGFMALGMMLPGMISGWLQELIGYQNFFIWVMLATIPSFLVCWLIPLDANFGKKTPDDLESEAAP